MSNSSKDKAPEATESSATTPIASAIRQISDSGALAGRDVAGIWQENRDYRQSISGEAKALISESQRDGALNVRSLLRYSREETWEKIGG